MSATSAALGVGSGWKRNSPCSSSRYTPSRDVGREIEPHDPAAEGRAGERFEATVRPPRQSRGAGRRETRAEQANLFAIVQQREKLVVEVVPGADLADRVEQGKGVGGDTGLLFDGHF